MTRSMKCNRCGEVLTGSAEDDLVDRVQAHVRGHACDHGRDHAPSREQILARLAAQAKEE